MRRPTRTHAMFGIVAALHLVGFGILLLVIVPAHLTIGGRAFGVGLGMTAYAFGLRHAFDADHIAAIDNTVRKLVAARRPAEGVGLFFSLGHSTIVFAMASLVAFGVQQTNVLVDEGSPEHEVLGLVGATVSGVFLLAIGAMNVPILLAAWRSRTSATASLAPSGPIYRMTSPLFRFVSRDWHIYPIGVLFGLGFDTATEVALLVLAGQGGAANVPWYAVLALPTLFAAGMSLMDLVDGLVMARAYGWGDARALASKRFVVAITAASVLTALVVGVVELVSTWGPRAGLPEQVQAAADGIDLENVGMGLVAVCLLLVAATWLTSRRHDGPMTNGPDVTTAPEHATSPR